MKKYLAILALPMVMFMTSCQENEVTVNGEKVVLTDGLYAFMKTTQGDILIKLEEKHAPTTVANFIALAEGTQEFVTTEGKKDVPFYDGTKFHRVIPEFMIQGGDPKGTGQGGPGYRFEDEFSDSLTHEGPGTLSMANSGPGTNGSQFFITLAATPWLDGRHSVFGKVISGMDVVNKLGAVSRNNADMPREDQILETVKIIRVGKEYKNYDAMVAFKGGKDGLAEIAKAREEERRQAQEAAAAAEAERLAAMQPLFDENVKRFTALNAKAKTTDSGLKYVIHNVGNGPKPEIGDMVNVHYAGYLMSNGLLFDASYKDIAEKFGMYNPQREPYAPYSVAYGPAGQVIAGWKEGLQLLNKGGKATLIIPPSLAYGDQGAGGVIPPGATLVFDVEIVE